MKLTNTITRTLASALMLALLVVGAGCTDAVTGSQTFGDTPTQTSSTSTGYVRKGLSLNILEITSSE